MNENIVTDHTYGIINSILQNFRVMHAGYCEEPESEPVVSSSLSAIKIFKLLEWEIPSGEKTAGFILSCHDDRQGGFSMKIGGEPSVFATAGALIALYSLNRLDEEIKQKALSFIDRNAKNEVDHFMRMAVCDECRIPSPYEKDSYLFFESRKTGNSLYGENLFSNAVAVSSILRAGKEVPDKEKLISYFLSRQNREGYFADKGEDPVLITSYAVLRTLRLLGAKPDSEALHRYMQSLKVSEHLYSDAVDGSPKITPTYQVMSMRKWLEELEKIMHADELVSAARRGDSKKISSLLKKGYSPDLRDMEGWTPLLAASARGHSDVVDFLLNNKLSEYSRANPDLKFEAADALPIYMAGQSGDLQVVKLLLKKSPRHLFAFSKVNGHTLFLQAAFFGKDKHIRLLEYLLQHTGEILKIDDDEQAETARQKMIVATNVRGYTAYRMNTELWNNKAVAGLIEKYDKNTRQDVNEYYVQLLDEIKEPLPAGEPEQSSQILTNELLRILDYGFELVRRLGESEKHVYDELTGFLIQKIKSDFFNNPSFDINRQGGPLSQTPIIFIVTAKNDPPALARFRHDIARLFLENGADPDLPEKHPMAVDAVIRASVLNNFDLLKLISEYMDPASFAAAMNTRPPVNGLTALHDAVHRALTAGNDTIRIHLDQIRWMLSKGARADIEDHTGQTQLQLAEEALQNENMKQNAGKVLETLMKAHS